MLHNSNERFWQEYFCWLVEKVQGEDYTELLELLYEQEFVWFVANDDNRAADGLDLRYVFMDESGFTIDSEAPCSVLEMLIALSIRCEVDIMGTPGEDRSADWFWLMINNLGLEDCKDGACNADFVQEKLNIWLERRYGRNGKGGLFPLKNRVEDQRKTEIWNQMNLYLCENEDILG